MTWESLIIAAVSTLEAVAWVFWGALMLWFGLKFLDWIRACAYERRKNKPQPKCPCPSCSPELWSEMPAVVVIDRRELVTPDRPAPDPWMGMVKDDIEEIILDLDEEASHGH